MSDSYRAIAGSSQILKLLDNVVLLLWGDLLGSDTLQFGFKKGTSTTQCSWLVTEVAAYYLRQGTPVIATLLDCSKAFDKCQFSTLFSKLMDRKVPAVVIRMLVFVYEEQEGCVSWAGIRSTSFSITNGTRQGSVLSPTLFSVYLDDLLKQLRMLGLGCHMGGVWVGAAGYADDLILLAPSRSAMKTMLKTCEEFAEVHNLKFSTDPEPAKSKTKCIFMCGHNDPVYPAPFQLYGCDLPWVVHATHLGHELHQLCDMEHDAKVKRAMFIENAVQIQETFGFANPPEVLKAVQTYAGNWYGSMLWNLFGEKAGMIFNSWSTTVKVTWDVPCSTHRFLVDNLLAAEFFTVKQDLIGRYVNFFSGLLKSLSPEVRIVASMVGRSARSTTGRNLLGIERETGLDPWTAKAWCVRQQVPRSEVPPGEGWRVQYLAKLLLAKREMMVMCQDVEEINLLIDSLCSS